MIKHSISFITVFFLSSVPLLAQSIQIKNPISQPSVSAVINVVLAFLIQIGAIAVVLAIVYAGFMFVAAQGNPEKINKAKQALFWTIIGAMILLGAQVISSVIENTLKEL